MSQDKTTPKPSLEWVRGYQAAREQAARIASDACLAQPDGGSPSDEVSEVCEYAAYLIRLMQPEARDV